MVIRMSCNEKEYEHLLKVNMDLQKENEELKGVIEKSSLEEFHKLHMAVESSGEAIFITDLDGLITYINPEFTNLYGYSAGEVIGKTTPRILKSGMMTQENYKNFWVNILNKEVIRGELVNKTKEGRLITVEGSANPILNEEQKIIGFIGVQHDISARKLVEEALKQSEERFRSLTRSANAAIITTDTNEIIIGWNKGAEAVFGYTEKEMVGKSLNIIIHEDFRNRQSQVINLLKKGGGKYMTGKTVELNGLKKNGVIFPVELSFSEWKTSEGQYFTGVLRDISVRKRTELENQVIYEITDGITATSNLDELLQLIHSALQKVVYSENIFVALHEPETGLFNFPYFVDKFDSVPSPTALDKSCTAYVFRTLKPFLFTQKAFDKLADQNEVELVGSASPSWVGVPLQTPLRTIGVLVLQHYEKENVYNESDVRFLSSVGNQIAIAIDRKQSETDLLASESNLIEAHKIAGLGTYNLDLRTGTWTSSEILDSIFGIDMDYDRSVNGWVQLVHPSFREEMSDYLNKNVIEGQNKFDKEYLIVRKNDGLERWVYGKGELIFESDNTLASLIGTIMDITQRKKAEEEIMLKNELLQVINAEKDKFFSILAHDLRGPLSAFVAATQIITDEIQSMELEEIKEITESMKNSAKNLFGLLENLLEWSRLRRGVLDFVPEKIILKEKISSCIDVLSELAREKKIDIEMSIPDDVTIKADNHMFDTVIRNLVSNAIKFTNVGGKVRIAVNSNNDKSVDIKISDSGIGMTPDLKSRLFLVTEKVSRKGTEGEPSTGLGLLLCKEFIEKHNGRIWVESEVGKGSTFSFSLPLNTVDI